MPEKSLMTWEEAVRWIRGQPDRATLVRDCFYDDPISNAARRYYASTEWQAVRREMPKAPGTALDIGAGRGISSFALASDGWTVIALEPDSGDLVGSGAIRRLVQEAGIDVEIVNASGEALPFPADSFDLVYCRAALHHARDLQALCTEVARVLRPGGCFMATREHVISSLADLDIFFESHPLHALYGGEYAYLLPEYTSAIRRSGLVLIKTINPFQSDINIFPETKESLKARVSRALRIVPARRIPDFVLDLYGRLYGSPGRLYSFIAKKRP